MRYHKIHSIFKRDMSSPTKAFADKYSLPEFEYLANNEWVFTEKIDGTNIRIFYNSNGVRVAGRTDKAELPPHLDDFLTKEFIKNDYRTKCLYGFFKKKDAEIILFGEGVGHKIQRGARYLIGEDKLNCPAADFILFDIMVSGYFLERSFAFAIAKEMGVRYVPTVCVGTLSHAVCRVSKGIESVYYKNSAEGLVGLPTVPMNSRNGKRIITKIKCCDDFSNIGF